jgi:hypothetical protein
MNKNLPVALAAVVFVGGTLAGVKLLTAAPEKSDAPTCQTLTAKAGSKLRTNLVTVNVLNASERAGLANRVLIDLQSNGFMGGSKGNTTDVTPKRVAIVTADRTDPRVKLVAKQFKDNVKYTKPKSGVAENGVTVVVGPNYSGLKKKAASSVRTDQDISVCVPTAPEA